MTAEQLQNGADWLYREFYRLDRILLRTFRTLFEVGPVPAYLTWKLNATYRYDNKREGIIGKNPAGEKSPDFVPPTDKIRQLAHSTAAHPVRFANR